MKKIWIWEILILDWEEEDKRSFNEISLKTTKKKMGSIEFEHVKIWFEKAKKNIPLINFWYVEIWWKFRNGMKQLNKCEGFIDPWLEIWNIGAYLLQGNLFALNVVLEFLHLPHQLVHQAFLFALQRRLQLDLFPLKL